MSTSTDGILAYGFDLGGGDGEWKIAEVDEDGCWEPEWSDFEESDLVSDAEKLLLGSVGFTETDWQKDGYFDRQRAAQELVKVEFVAHCSDSFSMWLLAACHVTASRGSVEHIDFAALEQQRQDEDWDGKLTSALSALGITPKQERPGWMLVSYWG